MSLLESLLVEARAGRIVAVACAVVTPTGETQTTFTTDAPIAGLLAGAVQLQHRLVRASE